MATTKEVAKKEEHKPKSIDAWIEENKSQLVAAIPKGTLDGTRFLRFAIEAANNSALAKCSTQSVVEALMDAANTGLELDGWMGHAYILPFKGQATFIIGYKGYGVVAMRPENRELNQLAKPPVAYAIHENDTYSFDLGSGEVSHVPAREKRGAVIYAWAQGVFNNGEKVLVVMNKDEIDSVMRRSPSYSSGSFSPWKNADDYPAMAAKTALRKLYASGKIPMQGDSARFIRREDTLESDIDELGEVITMPRRISEAKDVTPAVVAAVPDMQPPEPSEADEERAAIQDETQPAEVEDGWERITIAKMDVSSGKTAKGGQWKRYSAMVEGTWNITFDRELIGPFLQEAYAKQVPILVKRTYDEKYKTFNINEAKGV